MTVTDIEKIFDSCCPDSKQMLLNYESFTLAMCEPLNQERQFFVKKAYESLRQATNSSKNVDIEVLKSFYNPKNHPLGRDEEETYAEFVECLDIFLYSYKMKKTTSITYEEFEEFYRIVGFLIDDDEVFRTIVISEWKKTLAKDSEISSNMTEGVRNNNTNQVNVKEQGQQLKTPSKQDNYPNQMGKTTPTPGKTVGSNPQYGEHKQSDRQFSAQQHTYKREHVSNTNKDDNLLIFREKLRRRGIRGLMNLHKQFLLSCTNLGTISYNDFVRVLKLQKLELSKEVTEFIFESFRQQNSNYLNFPNFIRNFKKILNENRLFYVENVFSKLDTQKTEMLNIEDVKFKFDSGNHPDVLRRVRTEDDIITEFLDCFDLNYNFLVNNISNILGKFRKRK
jgi:Ca2+-binding EF-hand superfamily protein